MSREYRVPTSDPELLAQVQETLKDVQKQGIYPYPGLVKEVLESRGFNVETDVDQEAEDFVVRVRRVQ